MMWSPSAQRRAAEDADALIDALASSPSWGVSADPGDDGRDPLLDAVDRLVAQLPPHVRTLAQHATSSIRRGRDLRPVVLWRSMQLLSQSRLRVAWSRLRLSSRELTLRAAGVRAAVAVRRLFLTRRVASSFRAWSQKTARLQGVALDNSRQEEALVWKFQAGALRVVSIAKERRHVRSAGRQAFVRWRDLALGTFELVPRHTFMAAMREKQARIANLEAKLAEVTVVSEERQWLAQVLTKQLVREEDRGSRFKDQISRLQEKQGTALADSHRLPSQSRGRDIQHIGADGAREEGDASIRKQRPSQGIALEAVFSTASPLPAGGVQLLSHLEGETEAAGALLGRFDPKEVNRNAPHSLPLESRPRNQPFGAPRTVQLARTLAPVPKQPPQPPVPQQLAQPPAPPQPASPPTGLSHQGSHGPALSTSPSRPLQQQQQPLQQLRWQEENPSPGGWAHQPSSRSVSPTQRRPPLSASVDSLATPSAALRKLSDATVVAAQIGSDGPVQALLGHYGDALKALFGKYATKRVQGVAAMSENGWLRLTKNVGLSPSLISSKSLRHFAMCAHEGSAGGELTLGQFFVGLGLCAIYVYRDHQEEWSIREKLIALLASLKDRVDPSLGLAVVRVPDQFLGPRIEGFLWRLFEHFSGAAGVKGQKSKAPLLSNWGWSKLVKELRLADTGKASVHPDVMFNKHAGKGRGLSFEAFVHAITELDALIEKAPHTQADRRGKQFQPDSAVDENAAPLSNLLSEVGGLLSSTTPRDRGR